MKGTVTAVLSAISLLVHLQPPACAQRAPAHTSTIGSQRESYYSVSLPRKDRLALVARIPIDVEGQLLGEFIAYDDGSTTRPADYLELHNKWGDLLAVSWFDRFGIERLALDQGLVENAGRLEGSFVLVVAGDSI